MSKTGAKPTAASDRQQPPAGHGHGNGSAASQQLGAARLDNEILRQENAQLMRRLVSVSRRAEEADRLAHHDVLTGLPNRLLLIKNLQQAIAKARNDRAMLALLFIDLDGFKAVNDRAGHRIGDRLLAVVGARIAACVRADDMACRYGGDEFVGLLAKINDTAIVARIAQQVRKSVSRGYRIDGQAINITASVGIAMYPADGEQYDALLISADAAMYRCKAAGGSPRVSVRKPVAEGPESRGR
jgi:diguanylate cyclase (GGDEF)-like protein